MGCEQYKATDYSEKARACREKENKDSIPKEEQLKILNQRYKDKEKEIGGIKETLTFNEEGQVENTDLASTNIKRLNNAGESINTLGEAINELQKSMIPPTVEEWNLETESILDLNPDATAEDIEAIMQRPGGPNAAQKEFFKGREDYLQNKENPVNGEVISIYKEGTDEYEQEQRDLTSSSRQYSKVNEDMSFYSKSKRNRIKNNKDLSGDQKTAQLQAIDDEYLSTLPEGIQLEYKNNKKALNELFNVDNRDSWSTFKVKNEDGTVDTDYSESILPSAEVESALIDLLNNDKVAMRKLNNDTFNIENKEALINTAKYKVLSNSYKDFKDEFAKANELLYQYKDLKNVPQGVLDRFNKIRKGAVSNLQASNAELAYNAEENAFANSFKMTDQFREWRDKHIDGGLGGDLSDAVGTFVQEGVAIATKATAGTSLWLSRLGVDAKSAIFGDDPEDEATQSYLEDQFAASMSYNVLGISDKDSSIFNDGFTIRSATKTIAKMLPFTIGIALSARKGDVKGLKSGYSMLKGMGASQNLVNKFRMGAFAYKATVTDNYMEGKDLGLEGGEAQAYANGMSLATAVVQGIMPDTKFFNTAAGQGIKNTFVNNLKKAATTQGRKTVVKQLVNNLGGEILEEEGELFMQDVVKASLGLSNEMKFFDLETQVETLVGTVLLTGATSAATAPSQISNTRKQVFNQYRNNAADMLTTIKDSKALAQQQLEKAKQNGNKKAISRAELQLSQIESSAVYGMDLIKAINIAPDIMNDNQVDLLRQKVALLRQKENLRSNSVGKSEIDAKIADIDLQIENSSVTENKQLIKERTDANVKKLAADNNIGFKQAKDSSEALSVIKENNKRIAEENRGKDSDNQIPLIDESDANGNGFIVQNADGSQDIVINEDVAGDNEAITTAQHEFFHGALFKTLQNNPGAISGMADGLRKEIATMTQTDVSFNNSFIQQKLDAYKNDPSSVQDEELLTIFSEGITEGYIKFEETSFTKLGDVVRRALSSIGVKAKFDTGKDVYNFIKDFNKGVEKGKFSKGIKKTIKEGAEVTLSKDSVFKYDAANEAKIAVMYSAEGNMQQKALKIANQYRGKVQALLNTTDNNVFGTEQKYNDIQDLLTSPDVSNSIFNTVMNYNPDSGISLDETIGRALMPKTSSKASKSGDIKSELDVFVQSQDGNTKYSSKKDFQTSGDFGLAFDKIENSNLLDGLIRQGVSEAYLDMNPDFVQNAKQRIGDKFAKEFDPTKNESLFGWLTGKNKSGQSIINLAKGDIQNKNKKNIDTTSIDASTRQIADTSTETKQEVENIKQINPDSVLPSGDNTTEFLTDTKKELSKLSTSELSDIRYNTSQSVAQKAFAKVFGIPASRIFNKKDNLRKGEAKEIQRFILKNASKLMKLLPEGNAPVRVVTSKTGNKKIKRGGESVALPRTLQNLFYNQSKTADGKPIKVDSESGKQSLQYKKNTTINQTEFLEAFGIKDGKVDPDFVPRSGQAQAIKGLMEIVARNVTNLAARQELEVRTDILKSQQLEAINKIGEGKSRSMKSRSVKVDAFTIPEIQQISKDFRNQLSLFQEVGNLKSGGGVINWFNNLTGSDYKSLKRTKGKYNLTPSQKKARDAWVRGLAESGLFNEDFFFSGNFAKSSRTLFKNITEVKTALKGVKFSNNKLARVKRTQYKNLSTTDRKKKFNTEGFQEKENQKMPYLKEVMQGIQTDISNNPDNITFWQALFDDAQNSQDHFLRTSAPIKFFTTKEGKVVEEHSMPASSVANFLLSSALLGNVDANFDFISKNYMQGALLEVDDKKMKGPYFNYISSMPAAFFTMTNLSTWVRYNNSDVAGIKGGIDFNNYQIIDTGKTVAETLAQQGMDIAVANIKAENIIAKGKDIVSKQSKPTRISATELDTDINNMIQDTKGIEARKRFSDIVAKRRGAGFKGVKLISAGAQDFNGLMYDLYGRGKKGEQQQQWVKDNLVKPYQKGTANIDTYRQTLKNDYASLLKKFPDVRKKLGKIVPGTDFTYDQALRVNLWTKAGYEIPGISKRDAKKLNDTVAKDPELNLFNDAALLISKQSKWVEPGAHWDTESLISDLNNLTEKVGRKQFLADFIENADVVFSKENLNKMEVALGTNWREAMEDSLYRMKNGTNRPSGSNKLTNQFNNWVNNSIGAIMFFNRKSALLQTISSVNFLNWSDNNPLKAAVAFGNQPQYWSDFATLWNSPKLKQRRSGLRKDVNEAELANAAKGAKNKPQAILSYLLKIGFTPTQLADSFAIASGGSTFYRNRANTYIKQGMPKAEAEAKAFEDFAETSDISQQSADPMLISQQQASVLGRLLLAFQNTPAQVTRILNKASRDFVNNRGDQKTNMSKMIYYGAIQGFIFAALQNALFATIPGFDDEEDEEKIAQRSGQKQERIVNSMADTLLRGSGIHGAIVATLKNTIMTYYREEKKKPFSKDHRNTLLEALNLSAPIGSKLRKINNAIKTKEYSKAVIDEQGWDVTTDGKVNLSPSYNVVGSLAEALTNLPLERMLVEINGIVESLDSRNTTFQRVALALGYRTWDVGAKNEEFDQIKIEAKEKKKETAKQKVIADREERKRIEEAKRFEGKTEDEIKIIKRKDVVFDQTRSEQITALLDLGLTKKEIKALKYEEDRVNKIIELQDK